MGSGLGLVMSLIDDMDDDDVYQSVTSVRRRVHGGLSSWSRKVDMDMDMCILAYRYMKCVLIATTLLRYCACSPVLSRPVLLNSYSTLFYS
jgi:hypothetical protein